MATSRFLSRDLNLALLAATIIDASSSDSAFPVAWLRIAMPTKPWRSKLGWNIVAGWNDKLDFNRGGVLVATIAAGNYSTGAALAAAIVTALEAADATPVWACSYDAVTKKFTISSDIAFTLLFSSGANVWSATIGNIGSDLGYSIADTGSATSHVAGSASYKSREWLRFDFGSAMAYLAGVAHLHNLGSSHTVKLLGKTAADVWATPGNTQTLAGDDLATKRIAFFASQSYRYALLLFEDTGNTTGYTELGVPFIGDYFQPGRSYQMGRLRQAEQLTTHLSSKSGAIHTDVESSPKVWRVRFQRLSRAHRNTYQAMEDAHGHMFFAMDPDNYPGLETAYGVIVGSATIDEGVNDAHSFEVAFRENPG